MGAALWAIASAVAAPVPDAPKVPVDENAPTATVEVQEVPARAPVADEVVQARAPRVEADDSVVRADAVVLSVDTFDQLAGPMVLAAPAGPEPDGDPGVTEGLIARNEFMADVLARAGVSALEADRLVRAFRGVFDFRRSRPGHHYRIEVGLEGEVVSFEYTVGPAQIYEVVRKGASLVGRKRKVELARDVIEVTGKVERSLSEALESAGASPSLAVNMAEAFRYDIDFFHHTRAGDRFRLFVERFSHDGEHVRYGRILAAKYDGVAGGPVGDKQLFWFDSKKTGTRGYYDAKGKSSRRAFLRSPLKFTRISSRFGYRVHPILKSRHFHGGVDYAAPTGTPVHAVADGRVTFAARKGPNGKLIKLRHVGGYESFYLHLSRMKVRRGQRVKQGQLIGKVGSTGRSTGPHLDFRLKKRGKYLNPTKHVVPRRDAIVGRDRKPFRATVAKWQRRLDKPTLLASR